jgi:ribosomal protein RSM22 (predicted rRNA methylase)
MTEAYRAGRASNVLDGDFRAYLTTRVPATYAAISACLAEVARLNPAFLPQTLCDVGAGPGTASWAAADIWPQLQRVLMRDSNAAFLKLAGQLAAEAESPALRSSVREQADIGSPFDGTYDLVTAAYVMAELPLQKIPEAAASLWRATAQALMIVEPGTPQGFARILASRKTLTLQGAHIAAPCVHSHACPMQPPDWCHFSVRLPRSRAHMHAKQARVPYEDEKYAYVIAFKEPLAQSGARVLAPPLHGKADIRFKLCGKNGLESAAVPARNHTEFKRAKKLSWGSLF